MDLVNEPQVWVLIGVFTTIMLGGMTLMTTLINRATAEAIDGVRGEIGGLRGEIGGELSGLRGEIGGLRGEIGGELSGLRGEIRGLRGEMNARFEAVHVRFDSLEKRVDQLDGDVAAADAAPVGTTRGRVARGGGQGRVAAVSTRTTSSRAGVSCVAESS